MEFIKRVVLTLWNFQTANGSIENDLELPTGFVFSVNKIYISMKTIEIAMLIFLGVIVTGSIVLWFIARREEREEVEELKKHLRK